ncbi:hypothetical protein PPROV_000936300 [Pycnococcus provasolii]|uniref:Uncharacterized protein n=1 Tax=Pycnococcus provasolii TaxID=41880 RepID=A0A830HU43_9CHLO|nr:hypothetical protein PPROV_000936300 [Pycnococcus provasolii]|mmetsp:Transcript_9841/g.26333  ORF Transcript_9841/g.26333 Transcript_9841/m.26333 type:complete len:309 (-) Transcript_9841:55-981(-)
MATKTTTMAALMMTMMMTMMILMMSTALLLLPSGVVVVSAGVESTYPSYLNTVLGPESLTCGDKHKMCAKTKALEAIMDSLVVPVTKVNAIAASKMKEARKKKTNNQKIMGVLARLSTVFARPIVRGEARRRIFPRAANKARRGEEEEEHIGLATTTTSSTTTTTTTTTASTTIITSSPPSLASEDLDTFRDATALLHADALVELDTVIRSHAAATNSTEHADARASTIVERVREEETLTLKAAESVRTRTALYEAHLIDILSRMKDYVDQQQQRRAIEVEEPSAAEEAAAVGAEEQVEAATPEEEFE